MIILRNYQREAVNAIKAVTRTPADVSAGYIVAMPTGTGKSIVIASSIRSILEQDKRAKILMITHSSKLVEQNAETMAKFIHTDRIGICSSSVKKFSKKELNKSVIFGTIQSFKHKTNDKVKYFNRNITHVFIDECHLVSFSEKSQYYRMIEELKRENNLILIGLSATPYRAKQTVPAKHKTNPKYDTWRVIPMMEHDFFDSDIIDLCSSEQIQKMIKDGFLCKLTTEKTNVGYDTTAVKIDNRTGDFEKKSLHQVVINEDINTQCVDEIIKIGNQNKRQCWIVFTCSIEHAEKVKQMFIDKGIETEVVHSKLPTKQVNDTLTRFKERKIQCLVNNDMLTTGFDNPAIDLIGLLRPTRSLSLYIQMLGRGTRVNEGKTDCLLLDFGENIERHGYFDKPKMFNKKTKTSQGDSKDKKRKIEEEETEQEQGKTCPRCGEINIPNAVYCKVCGCFLRVITSDASTQNIMLMDSYILAEAFQFSKGFHEKQIIIYFFTQHGKFPLYLSFDAKNEFLGWSQKQWSIISGGKETRATYEYLEKFISNRAHDIKEKQIYIHVNEKQKNNKTYRNVKKIKRFA